MMKLLLLHPLPFDGSVFPGDLSAFGSECVAPTLYGAGDDIVGWARAALDAVGDGPIIVVGNSIGGSVGIEVARLAPLKVKALVLCGSKPRHRPDPRLCDEALQVIERDGLRAAWERYWLPLFGPAASTEVIDHGWNSAYRQGPKAIAAGVRAFHGRPDSEAFLMSWSKPALIVSGQHDTRPARSRRLAGRLPDAEFRLVSGAGHYIPLEAPRAFKGIITDALAATT